VKERGPVESDDIAVRILTDDPQHGTCARIYIGGYVFYLERHAIEVLITALFNVTWPN
jgi:hypothetical protein